MTAVLFVVGAGAGALVRQLVNRIGLGWVGTLAVNVVGAFALGLLVAGDPAARTVTIVGAGILGNLTTFSTFALEATEGPIRQRTAVIGATLTLGLASAAAGYTIG
jgi:CrcB protein